MKNDSFQIDANNMTVKAEQHGLPKKLWLTTAAHFSNDFYNGFLSPLLPMLVIKLKISLALVGLLVSISSLFSSLLQPIAGWVADHQRRNYFVVFAPLTTGIFMSLIGVVDNYLVLAVVLALSGIGTSLFHPQAAALSGKLTRTHRGFSMSVFNMGGSLGIAVAPLAIVPIVSHWGLHALLFAILPALAMLYLSLPLLHSAPNHHLATRTAHLISSLKGYWRVVVILFVTVVIRATITVIFQSFIPLYLTSVGKSLFLAATAITVFQFCGTIGILVGGYYSDRMNSRTLLVLSFIVTLPFALLFIYFPSTIGLPFLGIAAFFLFSSTSVNIILGQQLLPQNVSFISGIMMGLAWGVSGLFATPVGAMADQFGLSATLIVISFLTLPGAFLAQYCPYTREKI